MPDRGYPMSGWRTTDFTRLHQGWFRVTIQRLWEHEDGRREWRKDTPHHVLPTSPSIVEMPPVKPTLGRRPA